MVSRRQQYKNERKAAIRVRKSHKHWLISECKIDVQGVLSASIPPQASPPPALNALDVVEQERTLPVTPREGQDPRKVGDIPKGYVCPAAHPGAANATTVHKSVSEVAVAPAVPPPATQRRALLLYRAHEQRDALPPDEPQLQSVAIAAGGKKSVKRSLTEINVSKLRLEIAPKLETTRDTFCVPAIPWGSLVNRRNLTTGGYGMVFTAKWNDVYVVIKQFRGAEAEKNACRELGQVQLGRRSWAVVAVCGRVHLVAVNKGWTDALSGVQICRKHIMVCTFGS